jgi:hypothetical protein
MITEFSLHALVDISRSRLSSSLNHVIFGLERPSMRQDHTPPPVPAPQSENHVKSNRFRQECVGHMSLLYANHDVEMLAIAFSNLCNLETVGIRDWSSRTRNRDYPYNAWNSKCPCTGKILNESWEFRVSNVAWIKWLIRILSRLRCSDISGRDRSFTRSPREVSPQPHPTTGPSRASQ